ncbi:MAG: hypothetical protein ABSE56_17145 [Bryobacteraceae bacterium]|jgi:hypothetical protein
MTLALAWPWVRFPGRAHIRSRFGDYDTSMSDETANKRDLQDLEVKLDSRLQALETRLLEQIGAVCLNSRNA